MSKQSHTIEFNYHSMPKPAAPENAKPLIVQLAEDLNLDGLSKLATLIQSGMVETDVNAVTGNGDNALHALARTSRTMGHDNGHVEILSHAVGTLMELGVDSSLTNDQGLSPSGLTDHPTVLAALGTTGEKASSTFDQKHGL